MNITRVIFVILLSLALSVSLASCKKSDDTEGDSQTTDAYTTAKGDETTADGTDTTDDTEDTETPGPEKGAYELFLEATKPLENSQYLDADIDHNCTYGLSGVSFQTGIKGNSKNVITDNKPVSLMNVTISINGANTQASIYADDQNTYMNANGQKTKSAIPAQALTEITFDESSFFDLQCVSNNGSYTFTGKCVGSLFSPVLEMLTNSIPGLQISQISDVNFTAVTDQNGIISTLNYSFESVASFSGAVNTTANHTGKITFLSFSELTITPPSDLGSYVG